MAEGDPTAHDPGEPATPSPPPPVTGLLDAVASGAGMLVCAVDENLRITYFNDAYRLEILRLTGRRIRLGDRLPELFSQLPELRKVVEEEWGRGLEGESVTQRIEFGDPAVWRRTYLTRKTPMRDGKGAVCGVAEVGFDVTAQAQAEAALAIKEAKASAVLSALTEGVIIFDDAGRVLRVNDSALRLLGCSREELENPSRAYARYRVVREDGSPLPLSEHPVMATLGKGSAVDGFVVGVTPPGGEERWLSVNCHPMRDGEGRPLGAVASFFDVTEHLRKERELAEAAAKFRIVADHTSDWEWWIGPDGRFLYCSPSCEAVSGHPREAFLADAALLERLVHPDDREAFRERHRERLAGGSRGRAAFRIVRPDGATRWVEHAWGPVIDDAGEFRGTRGSIRDVTDRVEAESLQRLAERYEAVGKLAGGVAHRINGLLSVIVGYSDALVRDLAEDDPCRVAFEEIAEAGTEAAEITNRLLSFSRRQLYAPRVVETGLLLCGMRKILEGIVGGRGEFVMGRPPGELFVEVDRNRFRHAMEELVTNARDALPPAGGTVSVRWGKRDVAEGEYAMGTPLRAGEYVFVEVADDGCGMDDRFLDQALDPFTSTKETGRGLGLPSVYGFVRQSDGFLTLASRRGEGTVVTLCFPRWGGCRPGEGEEVRGGSEG